MKSFLNKLNKLPRIWNMLLDKSEVFEDYPMWRFKIIKSIWQETL